jgi:hypothetical protein
MGCVRLRADSVLHRLLREAFERAQDRVVADHVHDALELLGSRAPYRASKDVLDQIEFARRESIEKADVRCSAVLADAASYMTGRALANDVELEYSLYDDSGEDRVRFLSQMTGAAMGLAAADLRRYLDEHPRATSRDLVDHLERASLRTTRFVQLRREGHYGAFRIGTENVVWVADVLADRVTWIDPPSWSSAERLAGISPEQGDMIAAAQLRIRRTQLAELEIVVLDPDCSEVELHRALKRNTWMFGGEFVGLSSARRMAEGTETDLTLLRPDGVVHVVELKRASVEVVKRHRGKLVPTAAVHDAAVQVAQYMQAFDENRTEILDQHGIDVRRASATVVIGHPSFQPDYTGQQVHEALRTYSSHLSRISVLTYSQLIDNARRFLEATSSAVVQPDR